LRLLLLWMPLMLLMLDPLAIITGEAEADDEAELVADSHDFEPG